MTSPADPPNLASAPEDALDLAFAVLEGLGDAPAEPSGSAPPAPREKAPPSLRERISAASLASILVETTPAGRPLVRRTGARAEEAWLRARVLERQGAGDGPGERETSIALARLLASRGTDLDAATALARRALFLGDDPALRSELAGWLAGLGEPALAAIAIRGLLSPKHPAAATTTYVRLAVLLARAGEATAAADALREASRARPKEAIACELLGTLAAWAPAEIGALVAATSYVEAAARREAAGEEGAAFEDRLRAFEVAPEHAPAAEALAAMLVARDRAGAADEVLRAHGDAWITRDAAEARAIHARRMAAALARGDAPGAVSAMLDGGLEGDLDAKIDDVLARAGLHELHAARLELLADQRTGAARARAQEELAKLYEGPLASQDRAIDAWIEAVASDPGSAVALDALRHHAATVHEHAPLIEALVRVAMLPAGDAALERGRVASLRELVMIAEEQAGEPSLARWALHKLRAAGSKASEVGAAFARIEPRAQAQDEALAVTNQALASAPTAEARVDALRRLASLHAGRPDDGAAYLDVLDGLLAAAPGDRTALLALERLARRGDARPLEAVLRTRLEGPLTRVELVRTRLTLAGIVRRRDGDARALDEVAPLLDKAAGHRGAASLALLLATRTGRTKARAEALVQLAAPSGPALGAVLLAVAGGHFIAVGDLDRARAAATSACEAEPRSVRAVSVLAHASRGMNDRVSAQSIERAMGMGVPRGALCDDLARALESVGEVELALAWTQRWLALKPGSPRAIAELIRRAAAARDPARVYDALAWVLAQAEPLGELSGPFAQALELLFQLDPPRALAVARRTLDVFGPKIPALRERLLEVADWSHDAALGVAVLERWVASGAPDDRLVGLLLELSRRRADTGDLDGAARELVRAAEHGADPRELLALADELSGATGDGLELGSDGLVAMAEARARALVPLLPAEAQRCALAWRELGGLRWDLADDRSGAELALFTAAQILPRAGVEVYARDLRALAGPEAALDALLGRAATLGGDDERRTRAAVLIEAATLAAVLGRGEVTFQAARDAILLDPSRADAVAVVERCADVEGGTEALDAMYGLLASAALGRYGRRAAHYRGARKLEERGDIDRAFQHAIACFEAVPSEGTSYVLLARLAEKTDDPTEAVRVIERVAAPLDPDTRAAWLKRAAALAGTTEEGTRLRFEVLLRALNVRPDPQVVQDVGAAMFELLAGSGEADVATMRFHKAVKAALPRLDGPEGARTAVAMAAVAVDILRSPETALLALERGMKANGDIDEYAELRPHVPLLASAPEAARAFLAKVRAAADQPYSSLGPSLLRLASSLAGGLGDREAAAALLVEAARRAPDDEALVHNAGEAAAQMGSDELRAAITDALPVARRVEALLHLAEKNEREGEPASAIEALARALETGELTTDEHDWVAAHLGELYRDARRIEEHEALLLRELVREGGSSDKRLATAREVAALRTARGDHEGALDVLAEAAMQVAPEPELLAEVRRLARRAGDVERQVAVLARLADLAAEGPAKLLVLRELAPLEHEMGDRAATAHYEAILRLDPSDAGAIGVLEQGAADRGDHEAIAVLLGHRIRLAAEGETRRVLRLRRAAVLEQRLGRLDDACTELEALLVESPDDTSALRFLADLHERLAAPLRAAPLWLRVSEIANTIDDKAEHGLRACRCYLAGGDVAAARDVLESVATMAPRDATIELRVELARRTGDGRALSDALDQLAATAHDSTDRRAKILLEAARAAAAIGDDVAALDRARRAAKLAPTLPDAVLEARRLEYRAGGSGTPREAQSAVDDLLRIEAHLAPAQMELYAFLLAEELDVIQGGGAGMRELSRRHAEIGPAPLVALGMAERLARSKSFGESLPLFERALAGPLLGLRPRGHVALAAAEAAVHANELEMAARLLEDAASEPDTRTVALRRQLELTAARGGPASAKRALEELAGQTHGVDRARVLGQLGRLVAPGDPGEAMRVYADAMRLAGGDRALHAQLAEEMSRLQGGMRDGHDAPSSARPSPRPGGSGAHGLRELVESAHAHAHAMPVVISEAFAGGGKVAPRDDDAPLSLRPSARGADEEALVAELLAGSYEAGDRLVHLYESQTPPRPRDVLAARKRQAALRPGERDTLEKLFAAAMDDGHAALARATEHVLCAFDESAEPVAPPPLSAQRESEELVAALLFRDLASPVIEALGIVWEAGLHRRQPLDYGLTGVERVQPSGATPLGSTYRAVARALGLLRTALFHQRGAGPLAAQVALLAPQAVVLTGPVTEETPELRYLLGAALAGAMPQHVLVNALPEAAMKDLLAALQAAFGPVEPPSRDVELARRVGELWQAIPPRAERRLRELCADPSSMGHEAALASTRQAMWRAGLFASGDLATTVRMILVEAPTPLAVPLTDPDGLARACEASPAVADIVRVATRMEYAEARWQLAERSSDNVRPGAPG